ncbi:hypothetical protein DUNSADRAFT_18107 [Dunaliella salina]|uniref:Uncharacterized protein n=1 Tax=Dunaliella salina TaxID=3046 RepID=A0ABQ7G0N5_DUNSA|nr:hypothetical protein DUNSADRAFT_18107 [Dunaliella salina]|eukprot:KAF5828167.1 hypothetical protein DUNSADRAFT_18107 [Dunaliella salina]
MELPDRHYPTNAVIGYMNDWTISQKARKARPLFEASPRERDAAFAALSKRVAIKQARKDKHQLFEAIVQHDHATCQKLINNAALLERHTAYGCEPLGLAAAVGDANTVSMFLEAGANPLAADGIGATALINASYRGHSKVVQMLLSSKMGGPAGREAMLRQCTRNGETALMAAAKGGHTEVLQVLLSAGADARACDREGRNALMLACKRNKVEAVQLLLGPSVGLSPEQRDLDGRTPLMHAAAGAALQVVQTLLSLQPPLNLGTRDFCPLGHTWLPPHHTVNTHHPPAAAAAAAAARLSLNSPGHSPPPHSPPMLTHPHTQLTSPGYGADSTPPRQPSHFSPLRHSTVIPHPPPSARASPIDVATAAKEAARAQVDIRKRADQEGKGGWGKTKVGTSKQQQALAGKRHEQQQLQQQQHLQSARGGWGGFEGSRHRDVVWDAPVGLTALEHAAASSCAQDARTLQVLAEAGERQVAQARGMQAQNVIAQGHSGPMASNAPASELIGASKGHGEGQGGVGGVPVALSESMADLRGVSGAVSNGDTTGASMEGAQAWKGSRSGRVAGMEEGEAGAAHQGALQLRASNGLGAGVGCPGDALAGQSRLGGSLEGSEVISAEEGVSWGRGMVADARDAEGGARLLWLAAEASNLAAVEWLLERGVGKQSLTDLDEEPMRSCTFTAGRRKGRPTLLLAWHGSPRKWKESEEWVSSRPGPYGIHPQERNGKDSDNHEATRDKGVPPDSEKKKSRRENGKERSTRATGCSHQGRDPHLRDTKRLLP